MATHSHCWVPNSLRRQQSKGAPGLAFETWDPCNQSQVETPTRTLSSRLPRRAVGAKPRDLQFHSTPNQCSRNRACFCAAGLVVLERPGVRREGLGFTLLQFQEGSLVVACEFNKVARTLPGNLFNSRRDAGGFAAAVVGIILDQAVCLPIGHV